MPRAASRAQKQGQVSNPVHRGSAFVENLGGNGEFPSAGTLGPAFEDFSKHGRFHRPRRNAVDRYALALHFLGQRLAESDERRFRAGVGRKIGARASRPATRKIEDGSLWSVRIRGSSPLQIATGLSKLTRMVRSQSPKSFCSRGPIGPWMAALFTMTLICAAFAEISATEFWTEAVSPKSHANRSQVPPLERSRQDLV